jgi:enoyl-CoA hydratase/carnithine racemase
MPAVLSDYQNKYKTLKFERTDGILEVTVHTDGGSLRWGGLPHGEFPQAFRDISEDHENRLVILTGTGDEFSGPRGEPGRNPPNKTIDEWDQTFWEGRTLQMNMLNIEVPMICALNGPALRHAELPLLCDIVIASETASIEDSAHYSGNLVPGDGVNVVYPMLLGLNRARYFMLTGQVIGAHEAKALGLFNEVLPQDQVLPRARELARELSTHSLLHMKYTRLVFTETLKREMQAQLGYSLILETVAAQRFYTK